MALDSPEFPTVIRVFSGDCSAPACLAKDGPYTNFTSGQTWIAEAGQTYLLLVSGATFGDRGSYNMNVVVRKKDSRR